MGTKVRLKDVTLKEIRHYYAFIFTLDSFMSQFETFPPQSFSFHIINYTFVGNRLHFGRFFLDIHEGTALNMHYLEFHNTQKRINHEIQTISS